MEPLKAPRVFISYSWESEDHKSWVRYLGERLYSAGIEARLDQWFVRAGESFTAFMEQEVEAADFVLVVCTPSYAYKSNNRQGGVGYEQQIVSGQLMAGTARSKFIPILWKGGYEPGPECAIPTHFGGIAWIDFRNEALFEESLEDLVRVIFARPRFAPPPLGSPPSLKTMSATLLGNGDSAGGEKRIELKPDDADAYLNRGVVYAEKGDTDRAIADYNKAIEIKPDHAVAYFNRGLAYAEKGDTDRAIADYNRAIELKPDYALAYYSRGNAYFDKRDTDRAIADYNKAIKLKPDYAVAYLNRGLAYYDKGDKKRAIADFNKAIELKPDDAAAYFNRGNAYFDNGDKKRAMADYNKAIELKLDYADAYFNRGCVYAEKGDTERAIADFQKSLELFTDPGARENALRQLQRLWAEAQ